MEEVAAVGDELSCRVVINFNDLRPFDPLDWYDAWVLNIGPAAMVKFPLQPHRIGLHYMVPVVTHWHVQVNFDDYSHRWGPEEAVLALGGSYTQGFNVVPVSSMSAADFTAKASIWFCKDRTYWHPDAALTAGSNPLDGFPVQEWVSDAVVPILRECLIFPNFENKHNEVDGSEGFPFPEGDAFITVNYHWEKWDIFKFGAMRAREQQFRLPQAPAGP